MWVSLMRMCHLESFVTEQLFIPECPPLSTPMTSEHSLTNPSSTHLPIYTLPLRDEGPDSKLSHLATGWACSLSQAVQEGPESSLADELVWGFTEYTYLHCLPHEDPGTWVNKCF